MATALAIPEPRTAGASAGAMALGSLETTVPPQSLPPAIGALLARGEATHAQRAGELCVELARCGAAREAAALAGALRQLATELENLRFDPFEPLSLIDTLSGRRKSAQERFLLQYARVLGALQALRSQAQPFIRAHQQHQSALRLALAELHLERQCLTRVVDRVGVLLSHLGRTLRAQGPTPGDDSTVARWSLLRSFGRDARTQLAQLGELSTLALEVHKCGQSLLGYRANLARLIEGEFERGAQAWQAQVAALARAAQEHPGSHAANLEKVRQVNTRLLHQVVDMVASAGLLERMELLLGQEVASFARESRCR